jgi:hypothetical protein
MKVLNLEIGSLQEELMEVKQINRILSLQMKKVKEDQARVNTTVSLVEMRLSEAKQLSPLFKLSTR